MLIEAAAIRRAAGERHRVDLARSLNDLGVVYNALTRYAEAESVLTESLVLRRAAHGDRHRAVGITASNLAAAFYYLGKIDSAMTTQALALSSLEASVGRDHSRTLIALGRRTPTATSTSATPGCRAPIIRRRRRRVSASASRSSIAP
jgi:hypothetical protein